MMRSLRYFMLLFVIGLPFLVFAKADQVLLKADKKIAAVGQPVTLTLTITGKGIDSIRWDLFSLPESALILKTLKSDTIIQGIPKFKQQVILTLLEPDTLLFSSLPVFIIRKDIQDAFIEPAGSVYFKPEKAITALSAIKPVDQGPDHFYSMLFKVSAFIVLLAILAVGIVKQSRIETDVLEDKFWALMQLSLLEEELKAGLKSGQDIEKDLISRSFMILKRFLQFHLSILPVLSTRSEVSTVTAFSMRSRFSARSTFSTLSTFSIRDMALDQFSEQHILSVLPDLKLSERNAALLQQFLEMSLIKRFAPNETNAEQYLAALKQLIGNFSNPINQLHHD
ncbi:hypothetical protein [Pedobacter metabolipauper]|uniref:Uncharacterized protein n=1 Tax=Pedobacter metabolipauper TaxID=425513 RepID=A0A4R6SVP5_9SPHI|nr:hypothetical protein [Pedobacter metabolipauper]TDQ09429.1 hypothetical protein ATK78_1583 [Pedobacter metabolipauper]